MGAKLKKRYGLAMAIAMVVGIVKLVKFFQMKAHSRISWMR